MRTCCFKVLVAWCVLTVLFSPVALHVPCPIALVMLVIKINTALGACVASLLILIYLPRAFSAPTASEMRIKVQQLEVAEKDLRHANRELQQQLLYRGVLERERFSSPRTNRKSTRPSTRWTPSVQNCAA